MKKFVRLYLGSGFVTVRELISLQCNPGLQDIVLIADGDGLWTGEAHIFAPFFRFNFGSITKVAVESSDCEYDQTWPLVWVRDAEFNYENYYKLAEILWKSV
jgi:hypothetical protein